MTNRLYLVHHGIKGQRWGVRRFQNRDGSLTIEGKTRYRDSPNSNTPSAYRFTLTDRQKKMIKIGAVVAGAALLAYGAYHIGTVKKVDARVTESIVEKLAKEHETYTNPKLNLTDLPKEDFIVKNLPGSKQLSENKQVVKELVRDQKLTDVKNAKELIRYGAKKLKHILGDNYVFLFGDNGPMFYKSKLDTNSYVVRTKIDYYRQNAV